MKSRADLSAENAALRVLLNNMRRELTNLYLRIDPEQVKTFCGYPLEEVMDMVMEKEFSNADTT